MNSAFTTSPAKCLPIFSVDNVCKSLTITELGFKAAVFPDRVRSFGYMTVVMTQSVVLPWKKDVVFITTLMRGAQAVSCWRE